MARYPGDDYLDEKVYLLYSTDFYEHSKLEGVFRYSYYAKEKKKEIEEHILELKREYFATHAVKYDIDCDKEDDEDAESRVILFRAKHKEMQIKHFEIEERELE